MRKAKVNPVVSELKLSEYSERVSNNSGSAILNREKFLEIIKRTEEISDLKSLKANVFNLKEIIASPQKDWEGIVNIDSNGDTISLRRDVLISELNQILEAQTIQRAKYYLGRLESGIQKVKTSKINDINLSRWKESDDIITDSLWVLEKRDTSGAHLGWYWGNFIPQIPHQLLRII